MFNEHHIRTFAFCNSQLDFTSLSMCILFIPFYKLPFSLPKPQIYYHSVIRLHFCIWKWSLATWSTIGVIGFRLLDFCSQVFKICSRAVEYSCSEFDDSFGHMHSIQSLSLMAYMTLPKFWHVMKESRSCDGNHWFLLILLSSVLCICNSLWAFGALV